MTPVTQARLKELFRYDPDTGHLIRLIAVCHAVKVGDIAGGKTEAGYFRTSINGHHYMSHRLVWLYVYGTFPVGQIDHINGVRDDNRLVNLRDVSHFINAQNTRGPRRDNKARLLGVVWCKRERKWLAHISFNKKHRYLGRFNTAEAASEAYLAAKRKLHPGCTI